MQLTGQKLENMTDSKNSHRVNSSPTQRPLRGDRCKKRGRRGTVDSTRLSSSIFAEFYHYSPQHLLKVDSFSASN